MYTVSNDCQGHGAWRQGGTASEHADKSNAPAAAINFACNLMSAS